MIKQVPFFVRSYSSDTETRLVDVLRSGFLTSGKIGIHVEEMLESYFNIKGAALMNSWTNGAVVALSSLEIGAGDEVVVPAMTFIATASAVKIVNATPILCDVSPITGNVEWEYIEPKINERTRAVFIVHMYGLMVNVKEIRESLNKIGREDIDIIEDAAHCFEGEFDGSKPGSHSTCAIFSFYATKNITCGEGGAVISSDLKLIEKCKISRLHGMTGTAYDRYQSKLYKHYDVEKLGYKANLPDLLAAMLPEQITKCDSVLEKREAVANIYLSCLNKLSDDGLIGFQKYDINKIIHARHLFPILVKQHSRDIIINNMNNSGIGLAVNFRSLTHLKEYSYLSCANAEAWGSNCISLPFYPEINTVDIDYVCENLTKALTK